jgi:BolA protein
MTRAQRIQDLITRELAPEHLAVHDESSGHNVPAGSESHFRVLVVSSAFEGVSRLARHRRVHGALTGELEGTLHALAIDAWTPAEWQRQATPSSSPPCRGGAQRPSPR